MNKYYNAEEPANKLLEQMMQLKKNIKKIGVKKTIDLTAKVKMINGGKGAALGVDRKALDLDLQSQAKQLNFMLLSNNRNDGYL